MRLPKDLLVGLGVVWAIALLAGSTVRKPARF